MKAEEFQKLLAECTEKTTNIRAFSEKWRSGVHLVPDEVASKIGWIVSLLQDQINKGHLCKKDEYLMIFNFQPLHSAHTSYPWSLDMVIRPVGKIHDLSTVSGTPLHLAVGKDGTVVNNTYALAYTLKEMGLYDVEDEEKEETEAPVCYGNYFDYEPKAPAFKERLTALQSADFSYAALSGETKATKESESLKADGFEHHTGPQNTVTFAFDSLSFIDPLSPSGAPISSSPVLLVDNSPSKVKLEVYREMPSLVVCKT